MKTNEKENMKKFAETVKAMPKLDEGDMAEYYSKENEDRRNAACEARMAEIDKELGDAAEDC